MNATVTMPAADLRGLAVYAADVLERGGRPELAGIHFHPTPDGAHAVATNGRGMAVLSLPSSHFEGTLPDAGITVPATAALKFRETEGDVRISLGAQCSILHGDRVENTPPATEPYPDYARVLSGLGDPNAVSTYQFGAREMHLVATALEFFAGLAGHPRDTVTMRLLARQGPHEFRLDDRDDLLIVFMPVGPQPSG